MSETITESSKQSDAVVAPPPPRRPRVREVSSRFMSPVVAPPSSSPARQQHHRFADADDNNTTETHQCLERERETPLRSVSQSKCKVKQHQRSKSSDYGNSSARIVSGLSRPDTPAALSIEDRLAAPQARLRIGTPKSQRSLAARLLRSSGMSAKTLDGDVTVCPLPSDSGEWSAQTHAAANNVELSSSTSDLETGPVSDQGSTCTSSTSSSPIRVVHNKCKAQQRSLADLRSSMPEADMLPTRLLAEKNCSNDDSSRFRDSPCSRSVNLPPSSNNCENSFYHSVKTGEKVANFVKNGGGLYMPPRPPRTKLGLEDARKGRKVSSHQEDVHSLRLLHNHYLQWRYANAKADVSMLSQRREAERTLYSLSVKISDLCNSVRRKRMELELLRRTENLSSILEAQMPDLDEWSALEGDYSISLSETIQALVNASLQLPISGNVRADTRDIGEALNSALKVMELITFHVQSFVPKAEEMENLISELARVLGGESALVEDCGELLSKTYASQVEECSVRGQLIQLHRSSILQTQE